MRRLLLVIYNLVAVPLLFFSFLLSGLFNSKIKRGIQGRRNMYALLREQLDRLDPAAPRIWFHVSSYGEFLQANPICNHLKQQYPTVKIVVSFFSPSGYEHVSISEAVDVKCYLPFDSYWGAKKFIALLRPAVAVIVRHDIWPNFVYCLAQQNIPLLLVDASLSDKSARLLPIVRAINRQLFNCMAAILTVSEAEAAKFRRLMDHAEKVMVVGDTKYDQVFERGQQREGIAALAQMPIMQQSKIWVVGSSWPMDEHFIIPAFETLCRRFDDLVLILAPHEPVPRRIQEIEERLARAQLTSMRLSQLAGRQFTARCLIVDRIGVLAAIYSLGQIAFVGGSFHYKVHNVLEPAVFGVPVLFGPKMTNSAEAQYLLAHDAAIMVRSSEEIVATVSHLLQATDAASAYGQRARQIVMQNVGSSEKIAATLLQFLPLVDRLKTVER